MPMIGVLVREAAEGNNFCQGPGFAPQWNRQAAWHKKPRRGGVFLVNHPLAKSGHVDDQFRGDSLAILC